MNGWMSSNLPDKLGFVFGKGSGRKVWSEHTISNVVEETKLIYTEGNHYLNQNKYEQLQTNREQQVLSYNAMHYSHTTRL